jgi:nucleotide-binding universal stress UspA family protein
MRILICMRKSECRHNALNVGGRIALATDSEITALFVLPRLSERFEEYFEAEVDEKGRSMKDRVEDSHVIDQRLLKEAREELARMGIEAEVKLRQGDPVKEAIEESVEGRYDLIVVGSRALHGIKAKLESFSERLIEHASIPVLVAHCISELSTILLCVEGTEQSRMTIEYAADFARAMEAGVTVLSVAKSEKEIKNAQKAIEYAENILKDAGITVTGKIRVGNPTDEIEKESVNYDLVLVGSHKFGILETLLLSSPSLEIVESSRAPTLVVREKGMD